MSGTTRGAAVIAFWTVVGVGYALQAYLAERISLARNRSGSKFAALVSW